LEKLAQYSPKHFKSFLPSTVNNIPEQFHFGPLNSMKEGRAKRPKNSFSPFSQRFLIRSGVLSHLKPPWNAALMKKNGQSLYFGYGY